MLAFLRSLFNPAPPSSSTAKERLRLVLLSDHLSLSPDVVEALKKDLLAVISRYVEIDSEHADVTFEHREREVAMMANIPITAVHERVRPAPVWPTFAPAAGNGAATGDSAVNGTLPSDAANANDEPLVEKPAVVPELVTVGGADTPAPDMVSGDAAPVPLAPPDAPATGDRSPELPDSPVAGAPGPSADGSVVPARSGNAAAPRRRRRKKATGIVPRPPGQQSLGNPAQA